MNVCCVAKDINKIENIDTYSEKVIKSHFLNCLLRVVLLSTDALEVLSASSTLMSSTVACLY